jgi:hypothetical protein
VATQAVERALKGVGHRNVKVGVVAGTVTDSVTGQWLEIDGLITSDDAIVIVEAKQSAWSKSALEGIEQIERTMKVISDRKFSFASDVAAKHSYCVGYSPEDYLNIRELVNRKKLYGVLFCENASTEVVKKASEAGIVLFVNTGSSFSPHVETPIPAVS